MHNETKKINLIVDEITSLLMGHGAIEINVRIRANEGNTVIKITEYESKIDNEFIERMQENFDIPRQYEVEEYYWQLTSDNEMSEDMYLIGTMVDSGTIRKSEDGNLYIEVIRNK